MASNFNWTVKLFSLLSDAPTNSKVAAIGGVLEVNQKLQEASFQLVHEGQYDGLIAFTSEELNKDVIESLTDGSFFLIVNSARPDNYSEFRTSLERQFDATVHLLDPDWDSPYTAAFGWKGEKIIFDKKILVAIHQRALELFGGGEVQVFNTLVKAIRNEGVRADVSLSMRFAAEDYDLVHLFSVYQSEKVDTLNSFSKPIALSPIYWNSVDVNWCSYALGKLFSAQKLSQSDFDSFLQAFSDGTLGVDGISREQVVVEEHLAECAKSVRDTATVLFPSGTQELEVMERDLGAAAAPAVSIFHGIDPEPFLNSSSDLFISTFGVKDFVLCVGRIEPMKNQLLLAYALKDSELPLVFIGHSYDAEYLHLVKKASGANVLFLPPQDKKMVASAYAAAKVHALPSFWELPGLVSLEAAVSGCPVVVSNCGSVSDYFNDLATYCDPKNPTSIRSSVLQAIDFDKTQIEALKNRILTNFTTKQTAQAHSQAYEVMINGLSKKRFLVVPDWDNSETWQPVVDNFSNNSYNDATLVFLTGTVMGKEAEDVQDQMFKYLQNKSADIESLDIELADLNTVGHIDSIIRTGSTMEENLFHSCAAMFVTQDEVAAVISAA